MTEQHPTPHHSPDAPPLSGVEETTSWRRHFQSITSGASLLIAGGVLTAAGVAQSGDTAPAIPDIEPTATGTGFYEMSYNVLGAQHGTKNLANRMRNIVDLASGKHPTMSPRMDIVGLQEVSGIGGQAGILKRDFNGEGYALVGSSQNYMAINLRRFILERTMAVPYPFYGANGLTPNGRAIAVDLQDRLTGKQVHALNAQLVAWNKNRGSDKGGALKRLDGANRLQHWAASKEASDPRSIVTIEGDFNSTNTLRTKHKPYLWLKSHKLLKDDVLLKKGHHGRLDLPYCRLTATPSVLQSAEDQTHGMSGHCPDTIHSGNRHIDTDNLTARSSLSTINQVQLDHILVSPKTARATKWSVIANSFTKNDGLTSDHLPLVTYIVER